MRSALQVAQELAGQVERWTSGWILTGADGGQLSTLALERAIGTARKKVDGLPDDFRYHDLRHYFVSLLIAFGADVKTGPAASRISQDNPRDVRAPWAGP